ncbi:kinase-like domain-containing protein [Cantharellus anzutake]|uniref:kinase-like domain-containing protein n=1 Tax=Cantharellus anzutake TaxID=1750568 RepID=UPI0019071406|nr:kinase-like domain-containing protein [Cantharellus anzutake]KAF8336516.1 kinase-like domain-containing protein [Cantharellus anzutake]
MSFDSDDLNGRSGDKKFLADGVQSTVYREPDASGSSNRDGWIAVKIVSFHAQNSVRPHNIVREHQFLAGLDHPNIIRPFDFYRNDDLQQYELRMPIIPLSLDVLLDSPHFIPSAPVVDIPLPEPPFISISSGKQDTFIILAKSIMFQLVSAIAYLHGLEPAIAHRDIKPGNVLIDDTGCIKLIDFGIAWDGELRHLGVNLHGNKHDSPYQHKAETADSMCCQVGSSVHRAPELLFSPDTYNAPATDLWSLGVTFAEFFTPLRLIIEVDWDDEDETSNRGDGDGTLEKCSSLIIPERPIPSQSTHWCRESLFDGSRGELGLIWSIFRIRGTPNPTTWPDLEKLPSAKAMAFRETQPIELASVLPNLPEPTDSRSFILDMLERLLVYDGSSRITARDLLSHPFLANTTVPLLFPADYMSATSHPDASYVRDGMSMRDILQPGIESAWEAMGL